MSWLLGPYRDRRTYATLAYLLLGLPLGVFHFTVVVTGLSLGLGLLVTVAGIPVLVGALLLVRALAGFERGLAWSLLLAPMPRHMPERDDESGFFWARLHSLIGSRRTWAEVAFLLLRLPLGVVDFTIAVTVISLMGWGIAGPIAVAAGAETTIGSWTIDTVVESLVSVPVSILFLLIGPRLLLGWGAVSGRIATGLLGRVETRELKVAVGEVLSRQGELDAFQILDQLELRFGRGPFLTPIRLEASLLALESNGRLRAREDGRRTLYALA